jgi:hypothetical protein
LLAALADTVRLAAVAAAALVDETRTVVPATINVAMASGNAALPSSARTLLIILIPSPE